jgi:hypothetical protein
LLHLAFSEGKQSERLLYAGVIAIEEARASGAGAPSQ